MISAHIFMSFYGYSQFNEQLPGETAADAKKRMASQQVDVDWWFKYVFIPVIVVLLLLILGLGCFHVYLRCM